MQVAKNHQGELVYASLVEYPQKDTYYCFCCHKKVVLKHSKKKKAFFSHQGKGHQTGESEIHLLGKELIFQWGKKAGYEGKLEERLAEDNRRGDVHFEELNLVIEIQCSPLSKEELEVRTRDYQKENKQVTWIIGPKYFNKKSWQPFFQYHPKLGYYLYYFNGEDFFLLTHLVENYQGKWRFKVTKLKENHFLTLKNPTFRQLVGPFLPFSFSATTFKRNLQKRLLKKDSTLLKEQEFFYLRQCHLLNLPEILYELSLQRLPFLKGTNLSFHYLFLKQLSLKGQKHYTWHQLEKEWLLVYYNCDFLETFPFLTPKKCFQSYIKQTFPYLKKQQWCHYQGEKIEFLENLFLNF